MSYPLRACAIRRLPDRIQKKAERLAVERPKTWTNGSEVRVEFLGGSSAVQDRILSHANAWNQWANVRFIKVGRGNGQVRVSFDQSGYWSMIGTDCLLAPASEATLNLQGFDDEANPPPESEWHRVVRHEFGHALGNLHEQQRPEVVARLDPAKVIPYFEATQGWSEQMIREQILDPMSMADVIAGPEDDRSIMMYFFDGSMTKDHQPIVGGTDIDSYDQQLIARIYPLATTKPPVAPPPITPPVTPSGKPPVAPPGIPVFIGKAALGQIATVGQPAVFNLIIPSDGEYRIMVEMAGLFGFVGPEPSVTFLSSLGHQTNIRIDRGNATIYIHAGAFQVNISHPWKTGFLWLRVDPV